MEEVLPLRSYEAAYSTMAILISFFIVAIILSILCFIYVLIKESGKKRVICSILFSSFAVLFVISIYFLRTDMINIVQDIIKYYPDAGYFL